MIKINLKKSGLKHLKKFLMNGGLLEKLFQFMLIEDIPKNV